METSLFKHIHKGMYYILSTGCDFCGIKKKGGAKQAAQKNHFEVSYRFVTSYLLSVKVTHENEKTKTADYTC